MSKQERITGSFFLVIGATNKGTTNYPRYEFVNLATRKTKPALDTNEIAVKLKLELPVALFEKPMLAASINIDGDVPTIDLSDETINNVQDVLRAQLGLDVQLTVVERGE